MRWPAMPVRPQDRQRVLCRTSGEQTGRFWPAESGQRTFVQLGNDGNYPPIREDAGIEVDFDKADNVGHRWAGQ